MTDSDEASYADLGNAGLEHLLPVVHGMGVRFTESEPGRCVAVVPIEGNGNHFGAMYAGVLFTVGEVLGGGLAISTFDSSAYYPLVKGLDIRFLKPATTDITATASIDPDTVAKVTAMAEENGKADFVLEAELTDTNGVVVARTVGDYQLRSIGR
ncbi:YiiD C-terminal domain-containing protein [Nocardioides speluncae]|uniref:YiiD C-terminal domain-containing protein n=1 Tax=Nocardioides speluncae TaxID=2670337 RepID=UPI000D689229|nr:YiiD C-terminal domain-containing protein [Nocardioides speluncae]